MNNDQPLAYEAYQRLAAAYSQLGETKPHNAYYERPAMLELLPDVQGKFVLDAGCGPGIYARELAQRGATVTAVDASDNMLREASQRLKDVATVSLRQLDMSKVPLPFEDQSFDLVNAPLCMDYIEDWRSVFAEFFRVLKPGGNFLFSCGHPASDAEYFKTKRYFEVEQVKATWSGFGIKVQMPSYRRPLSEIINCVVQPGFSIEKVVEPLPTDDFKKADLRRYLNLMHRPVFLCIRAKRPLSDSI